MKIRTIATIAAAVMGLSLLAAPAFADSGHRGGGHGYNHSYGRGHDDCNDRRHTGHRRHGGDHRYADRRGGRGDHDGRRGWRDHDRRGHHDGHRGRDRHRDRDRDHDWNDGRRGR